nr:TPA_inf: MSH5 [Testicularia cyperi]
MSNRAVSLDLQHAYEDSEYAADEIGQQRTALALEVHQGRFGCVVFSEEGRQLLVCEDRSFSRAVGTLLDTIITASSSTHEQNDQQEDGAEFSEPSEPAHAEDDARSKTTSLRAEGLHRQDSSDLVPHSSGSMLADGLVESLPTQPRHRLVSLHGLAALLAAEVCLGLQALKNCMAFRRIAPDDSDANHELYRDDETSLNDIIALEAVVTIPKSVLSISAVGPLLSCLRASWELGQILSVQSLSLDSFLFLDEDTLKGLSICSNDDHAFIHATVGREGFSMLEYVRSSGSGPIGSQATESTDWLNYIGSLSLLRRWLLSPLAQKDAIMQRHDAVELLLRQESTPEVVDIRLRLTELANVPQHCYQLNMGVGSVFTWERLYKACTAILRVRALLGQMRLGRSELLLEIKNRIGTERLVDFVDIIQRTIDWEESKLEGKIAVRSGIDEHLDTLRANFAGLPDLLSRVAGEIRQGPAFADTRELHVVYFPQIGYLIVVPGGEVVDMLADPTLEQQFASERSVYLKNGRMVDMDQHMGDLASFIVDREIEILDALQTELLRCCPQLVKAHAALQELDCLLAFARAAVTYELKRPVLLDEPALDIKGCRHPLKALSDESFVPNDIQLRGGRGLSGSSDENAEGEDARSETDTANAKQGEHIVMVLTGAYLSQCGCFVPAAQAELGVFDKILTRMRQDESVASEGSSFTRELGRLNRAITLSTSKSLVLLDEVGRECRSDDGAGLFVASILEFLDRDKACPVVLATTHHLRAIMTHLSPELPIYRAHMQTVFLPTIDARNTLTYLYRLRPGFASTSHANHCALLCGVPESVVERANVIGMTGLHTWQNEQATRDEAVVRRLVELDLDDLSENQDVDVAQLVRWILTGNDDNNAT